MKQNTYNYRRYLTGDVPSMIHVMKQFHADTAYADVSFDDDKVANMLYNNLRNDMMFLNVVLHDKVIVGGMWAFVAPFLFSKEVLADAYGMYVDPKHRRASITMQLFDDYIAWAKRRGVKHAVMSISTEKDIKRFEKVMGMFKLEQVGSVWRKRI